MYVGQKLGKLTIRQRVRSGSNGRHWLCDCDCGRRITVPQAYLNRKPNPKRECGECGPTSLVTSHQREYHIYRMMIYRCTVKEHSGYKNYGGRGIKVHPDWLDAKEGFKRWFEHVGVRPSPQHTIDRINNEGNYEPGNVRWATPEEQAANKRPISQPQRAHISIDPIPAPQDDD